jgi:hypothetical protein
MAEKLRNSNTMAYSDRKPYYSLVSVPVASSENFGYMFVACM